MPEHPDVVLGRESLPAEDELRLPKPPGVFRQFWARHPLGTDILIAVIALLISIPAVTVRSALPEPADPWMIGAGLALVLVGCVALVWRRRWPVTVFAISLLPALLIEPELAATLSGPVSLIAIYSVAVYRGVRACWIAFGAAAALIALRTLALVLTQPAVAATQINVDVSTTVALLLGALVGINVGNRRRYLSALIDRSRQLLVERDQQAALAAASERARIAREMHDIVSHSLTVIVALSEGASATADPVRAREASRAVAATAREALSEMRMMLGVLRGAGAADDAPLGPLLDASLHDVIEAARAAGFPATLSVSGDPDVPSAHRLAILRVVQEAITNAMRYSRDGSFIRVITEYSPGGVRIVVENDGAHPEAESAGAGWGLRGLEERVGTLGGTVVAGLAAPGLWRLTAELPRDGEREEAQREGAERDGAEGNGDEHG
ncbi:histidine kinase [Microbacterium yannicii]|uniref:histidine kinase n=1 Tax=Microbacterium yannicii TaxID=671622 RepID=A0ABP9MP81_9MICO|nr:histidine kinase [Microbacterium yannicii]MCO5952051.1 histidine kinase [Microbacterium yannicii]